MKKLSLLLGLLLLSSVSFATEDWNIGKASSTLTNEGVVWIPKTPPGTVLWKIVIGSPTIGGVIGIYDSSATFNNFIASVSLSGTNGGPAEVSFEVRLSSGLSYKTSGNSNGVTLIYKQPVLP